MKNIVLLLSLVLSLHVSSQQTEMNQWSVGLNLGSHDGMSPTSNRTRVYQLHHYGLNGRYMFNNRFGLMLDAGYDMFKFYNVDYHTNYVRTSIQGVVNAGDMLKLNTISERLGFLIHGGTGLSTMWQKDFSDDSSPLFNSNDDMLNFIFGARPQYLLNNKIALNADLSFIFHARQSRTFDYQSVNKRGAIDGYMLNLSIGASYYFGKNEKHADWISSFSESNSSLEDRIKALEEGMKDDDNDGVPNSRDEELETPEGKIVDSKGREIKDTDGDGILDPFDLCPDIKGVFSADGCLDSDGDGLSDDKDDCPTVPGPKHNKGCPVKDGKIDGPQGAVEVHKFNTDISFHDVQFEFNQSELTLSGEKILDEVIEVLNANASYKLRIEGFTDSKGSEEYNIKLSQDRAEAVGAYLTKKGIAADRLITIGYGEGLPKDSNETDLGRTKNRRVELVIGF